MAAEKYWDRKAWVKEWQQENIGIGRHGLTRESGGQGAKNMQGKQRIIAEG